MKTTKSLLAAAVLTLSPGLALAQECNWMKTDRTAMSCAEGTVLDAATGTCVEQVTS